MSFPETPPPARRRGPSELRVALVCAALMLAISYGARLAARYAGLSTGEFADRSLMAILAAFIVLTGNSIPKRLASLACANGEAARVQAFLRFAGWTWVLTGLAFGLACLLLPRSASTTATFVIVPTGMALELIAWLRLYATRRRAA